MILTATLLLALAIILMWQAVRIYRKHEIEFRNAALLLAVIGVFLMLIGAILFIVVAARAA